MIRLSQVILALHPSPDAPPIHIVARLPVGTVPKSSTAPLQLDPNDPRTIVAVRQGKHLMTTFHPELTKDGRFHEYFVQNCVLPSLSM